MSRFQQLAAFGLATLAATLLLIVVPTYAAAAAAS